MPRTLHGPSVMNAIDVLSAWTAMHVIQLYILPQYSGFIVFNEYTLRNILVPYKYDKKTVQYMFVALTNNFLPFPRLPPEMQHHHNPTSIPYTSSTCLLCLLTIFLPFPTLLTERQHHPSPTSTPIFSLGTAAGGRAQKVSCQGNQATLHQKTSPNPVYSTKGSGAKPIEANHYQWYRGYSRGCIVLLLLFIAHASRVKNEGFLHGKFTLVENVF